MGTDSALYRDGKLLVAQTMSADGKAFMRIAQFDLQSTAIEVLTEPVVDSVVSVTNNVLAYCEMREGGFAVCLRSLKDGGIAQCAQSDAPVDVIATQSGFALDGQLKPCSEALNDDLYYVNTANLRTVVVLSPNKSALAQAGQKNRAFFRPCDRGKALFAAKLCPSVCSKGELGPKAKAGRGP